MRRKRKNFIFGEHDHVSLPKQKKQKKSYNFTARYIGIAAFFLMICLFYLIKLGMIQHGGLTNPIEDTNIRTYSASGLRGEIYDRNGKKLVGNEIKYNIVLEYGSIPDTTQELNRSILDSLEALDKTNAKDRLSEDLCAFEGSYPDVIFSQNVDPSNKEGYAALRKILDSNKLPEETSAKELASAFVKKYRLYGDLYTPAEIDRLLRVRYEMERVQFGYYQPYTLAKDISAETVSYIKESGIDGINFKIDAERVYYYPGYASHLLGRIGKIQTEDAEYYQDLGYSLNSLVGISGCEQAFDRYLHAEDGILAVEYDNEGNIIKEYYEVEPVSGNDVWLTIDIDLQIATEDSLRKNIESIDSANAGSAVSLDPSTGAVLAMASYPTFDITQMSSVDYYNTILQNKYSPELNRATSGLYAPGSTYKPGASLAALEAGHISAATTYFCDKAFPHLHNPTCLGRHGAFNVSEAIRESCNVFFYYLGYEMGTDNITKYTKPLGLGAPTGIEIGERIGTVAGKNAAEENGQSWDAGHDLSAAIGQSLHLYTPLQLGVYTATLSNGGTRYEAHLLHSVRRFYTGEVIYTEQPQVLDRISFSDGNRSTVLSAMRDVIYSNYTMRNYFSSLPVEACGKTGTAEVSGKEDYALFIGAAPYNAPEIVAACVIEEGVYGSNASLTVSDIFKAYYAKKEQ